MTFNIAQTPEQVAVNNAVAELDSLKQERDRYLESIEDPRTPYPARSLSEIRDDIEIAEARLAKAQSLAEATASRTPTVDEARHLLATATDIAQTEYEELRATVTTLDSALAALEDSVSKYNATLARTRAKLTKSGIPAENSELDDEPIDLTGGGIEHGPHRFRPIGPDAIKHYLIAASTRGASVFPREPGGWSAMSDSYRAGSYWKRLARR